MGYEIAFAGGKLDFKDVSYQMISGFIKSDETCVCFHIWSATAHFHTLSPKQTQTAKRATSSELSLVWF